MSPHETHSGRHPRRPALSGDVRRLTLDDLPGCLDLAADREWPREEHKWRLLFEVGEVLGIVETGEGVVGTTVITCYDPGAAISMVLVAARREWRGFASRMMPAAMERAGSGPVVLYATEYGRLPDGDLTRRFAPLMQALG